MKRFFFLLLLVLINVNISAAQSPSAKSAEGNRSSNLQKTTPIESKIPYQLGNKRIIIPSPQGFVEAASKIEAVKTFFSATEDPNLDLLAVHLPEEIVDKVKGGKIDRLAYYTKVSVSKRLRERDFSQSDFSGLVSNIQTNSAKVFDLNSPGNKLALNNLNKNLSNLSGQDVQIDFSTPVNLGEIVKTPEQYGALLLVKTKTHIEGKEEELILLAGASLIRVRERLIFVYTYRAFNSDKDIEIIRGFTRQWLDEIVKAN